MNISKLNIGGTTYDIKDSTARTHINNAAFVGDNESDTTIPEFDAATQSVHITEQTLSNAQKIQARKNINAVGKLDLATWRLAGLMSSEDKKKLDTMSNTYWLETSYIINQTETSSLPEDMIEDHLPSMLSTEKTLIDGELEYVDVIARIRDHSHIYVGLYDTTNDKLLIKQVSDTDKSEYADGTTITLGEEQDVFMKLPLFWWKCEEIESDKYRVTFSMTQSHVDNTWNEWEGNDFIGVYEGVINNSKLYSKPGVTPTVNETYFTFSESSRSRFNNNYYTLVTYEQHKMLCLLSYGWASSTELQGIIGSGTNLYSKTTGLCDSKGMIDSDASVDGNSTSINFWGIENWWGDIYELIDNIITGYSEILIIANDQNTVTRTISYEDSDAGEIKKIILGSNGDVIPKQISTNTNYNRAYASFGAISYREGRVAVRSGRGNESKGGVNFISIEYGRMSSDSSTGSRLCYKGNYEIVDSFE